MRTGTYIFVYEENRAYVFVLVNGFDEQKGLDLVFKKYEALRNVPKFWWWESFTLGNWNIM